MNGSIHEGNSLVSGVRNVEVSQLALLAARQGVGVAVEQQHPASPFPTKQRGCLLPHGMLYNAVTLRAELMLPHVRT